MTKQISGEILTEIRNDNRAKILLYSNVWIIGGIERASSVIMESLAEKYNVILVSSGENDDNGYKLSSKIKHIKIKLECPEKIIYRLCELSEKLDISLFIGNPNSLPSFIKIYPLLKNLGIKTIAWNHYNYFFPYMVPFIYNLIPQRAKFLQAADVSVWVNSFSALAYANICDNGAWLPNPCPFKNQSFCEFGKTIISVARFKDPMKMKRLDLILKSFQKLLEKENEAKLIIVGSYDRNSYIQPDYKQTIGEIVDSINSESHKVIFVGEQPDVTPYYLKSSVFIMASESEGFGMVLTEAGSFGLPCVIFEIPGIEDIITNGQNGFIVPFGDTDVMAEKLYQLISDKNLHEKMSEKTKQMVLRFEEKAISEKWKHLVSLILSNSSENDIAAKINEQFMPQITTDFKKRLVFEYKKNLYLILKQYNKINGKAYKEDLNTLNNKWNEISESSNIKEISGCYESFAEKLVSKYRSINPIKIFFKTLKDLKLLNLIQMTFNNFKQYGIKDTINKIKVMLNLSKT